jgi:hypothetical protein
LNKTKSDTNMIDCVTTRGRGFETGNPRKLPKLMREVATNVFSAPTATVEPADLDNCDSSPPMERAMVNWILIFGDFAKELQKYYKKSVWSRREVVHSKKKKTNLKLSLTLLCFFFTCSASNRLIQLILSSSSQFFDKTHKFCEYLSWLRFPDEDNRWIQFWSGDEIKNTQQFFMF